MVPSISFFSAQDFVAPPVVESDNYFPIGNSFAGLVNSEHFDCYSKKDWGDFSTMYCKYLNKGCSWEDG
jgi:hypothetical protein